MITVVKNGWKVGGLIAYLLGPGRAEEHRNPRVIASWDGRDAAWQPRSSGPGEWDMELGPLIRAMRAPAIAAGLPEEESSPGARGYVWHTPVRNASDDRALSDSEWAEIARELVDAAGVAPRGDVGGARWLAVRHADDHIHLVAVLVRQDTARRFRPFNDYPKLRVAARSIERRLGLASTAPADGTAAPALTRGEAEKSLRAGTEPARTELARAVKEAAIGAVDLDSFCTALRTAGYLVDVRRAPSGDPLGFKVARPGDRTASGATLFYSGSKLAPDLSLPRLQRRWATTSVGEAAVDVWRDAPARVERARQVVARDRRRAGAPHPRGGAGTADAEDIAHGAGDLAAALAALARSTPAVGRDPAEDLVRAAVRFDRAARAPRTSPVSVTAAGGDLRWAARHLVRRPWFGPRTGSRGDRDEDLGGMIALIVSVAALMREIAAWQRAHGRAHQAIAADAAAGFAAAAAAATTAPATTTRTGASAGPPVPPGYAYPTRVEPPQRDGSPPPRRPAAPFGPEPSRNPARARERRQR